MENSTETRSIDEFIALNDDWIETVHAKTEKAALVEGQGGFGVIYWGKTGAKIPRILMAEFDDTNEFWAEDHPGEPPPTLAAKFADLKKKLSSLGADLTGIDWPRKK